VKYQEQVTNPADWEYSNNQAEPVIDAHEVQIDPERHGVIESIILRQPYPSVAVDPLSIAPDAGKMGELYVGARDKYQDGMTLACATPLRPYNELVAKYEEECQQPGFSDVVFFEKNFSVIPPDEESIVAQPGISLDDYTNELRPKFIFPNTSQGSFDIWLPYDRTVAGIGRFGRHSFLWDGYQIAKGYAADNRWDLVLDILDNTEYQINTFGYPLNGSADFYVTRAQPDYFAHEVRMLADKVGPEALVRYLPALEKNHMGYWMDGVDDLSAEPIDGRVHTNRTLVRMPDGSFLNRYWDDADGPRLESYKEDVEIGDLAVTGLKGAVREKTLSKVYKDLRAGAASGWDYSSRWFMDGSNLHTINTTDIAPIDLNSLLAYNEETLAMAYEAAADTDGYDKDECLKKSDNYRNLAARRIDSINKYLWDDETGIYRDYNFVVNQQTKIISAATVYPLYVGIASAEQSFRVAETVERDLLYPGGVIATTTENSDEQWDGGIQGGKRSKNVWAPPNWAAVRGFARMAHKLVASNVEIDVEPLLSLAEKTRVNYMRGIEIAFETHGVVPEKHRGDDPATLAGGGEYELVKSLAMTSETYRAMLKLNVRDAADHMSLAKVVPRQSNYTADAA
jgi:alpha,alpha-trehalase